MPRLGLRTNLEPEFLGNSSNGCLPRSSKDDFSSGFASCYRFRYLPTTPSLPYRDSLRNSQDETAMDIAIRVGSGAIVKQFLAMNLDLQDESRKVPFPFRYALDNEQYHISQIVLLDPRTTKDEKARLNLKRTFHAAVRVGDCIATETILSLDREKLASAGLQGEQALFDIIESYGQFTVPTFPLQMVDCLLSSCLEIDINLQNHEYRSALWHAVSTNDEKLIPAYSALTGSTYATVISAAYFHWLMQPRQATIAF
ncbi:hypothetical protein N7493_002604 [Penicillium malachiteum]|uniref:Uncharacterized protein n=1 Tax=Penicillium malachiteum TaxID=1324776 RepID=A0AAD6HST3_9EURO|nr:hypothetical protein N7493_002604 [Penicillium malachiteum]